MVGYKNIFKVQANLRKRLTQNLFQTLKIEITHILYFENTVTFDYNAPEKYRCIRIQILARI